MIEIRGKFNTAFCYAEEIEETAENQIRAVCDEEAFADSVIRIMPDVHAGAGCTIGTTMTVTDKIVPGMVGVDIGCGMETVRLREKEIDFARLDEVIRKNVPSGRNIRDTAHEYATRIDLNALCCASGINAERAERSIGTLGGGNHFIEIDRGEDGTLYLVVHSGSRHLGVETANYYQKQGKAMMWGGAEFQIKELIKELKESGREREIEKAVRELRKEHKLKIPDELCYVCGELFDDYIHDMRIVQYFASQNRRAMVDVILRETGLTPTDAFTTIHNYIDTDAMILRKGSVSAKAGEKLLIPINMRDGSLICTGKGNAEWNFSAPHGAGRIMSRAQAKKMLDMDEYRAEMAGIYSTCVMPDTIDESPMAYKSIEEIERCIVPTVQIIERIKPVYNFKASE